MSIKLVPKTAQFTCEKCKRNVIFKYLERQFFSDEVGLLKTNIDKITSYGKCKVAEEAAIPNHPIHNEMQQCPIYNEIRSL